MWHFSPKDCLPSHTCHSDKGRDPISVCIHFTYSSGYTDCPIWIIFTMEHQELHGVTVPPEIQVGGHSGGLGNPKFSATNHSFVWDRLSFHVKTTSWLFASRFCKLGYDVGQAGRRGSVRDVRRHHTCFMLATTGQTKQCSQPGLRDQCLITDPTPRRAESCSANTNADTRVCSFDMARWLSSEWVLPVGASPDLSRPEVVLICMLSDWLQSLLYLSSCYLHSILYFPCPEECLSSACLIYIVVYHQGAKAFEMRYDPPLTADLYGTIWCSKAGLIATSPWVWYFYHLTPSGLVRFPPEK